MRLLLDTHYLYWMVSDPAEISTAERRVIDDPDHELLASPVSIWELRIKWHTRRRDGQRKSAVNPEQALAYIAANPIAMVELTGADCSEALHVPIAHRDPFDEQLLLHAQRLDAKLLTRDRQLAGHPLIYRFT